MRSNYGVPLWMGESGENSNHWYYEVFKLLEENNIGWNFWTHKKVENNANFPYRISYRPKNSLPVPVVAG